MLKLCSANLIKGMNESPSRKIKLVSDVPHCVVKVLRVNVTRLFLSNSVVKLLFIDGTMIETIKD